MIVVTGLRRVARGVYTFRTISGGLIMRRTSKKLARIVASFIIAASLPTPVSLAQGNGKERTLRGYSEAGAKKQVELEQRMRAVPKAELLRQYMERLAAEPHHVGTEAGKKNAEFIRDQFRSWGFKAELEEFDVLFPTPKERLLELIEPTRYR